MTLHNTSSRPLRWLAVLMVVGCFGFVAFGINALLAPCARHLTNLSDYFLSFLAWIVFTVVGWLITFYRPQNRIGWLCLLIGLLGASLAAINQSMICLNEAAPLPERFEFRAWLNYAVLPYTLIVSFFVLLIALFPNGRFLSPRWRNGFVGLLAVGTIAQLIVALAPDLRQGPFIVFNADNPFAAVPAAWVPIASNISFGVTVMGALLGVVSMIVRFRRARGDERQQLKWLTYFVGTFVALQVIAVEWLGDGYFRNNPELVGTAVYDLFQIASNAFVFTVSNGFPLIIGLTVFKYRLYDIDIIIRRTLQYALVTGILALTYFGGIIVLQGILGPLTGEFNSPVVTVITTLGIAALFTPLRNRVQNFIDRRFYRKKYNAEQMLANFALVARDEVDMEKLINALLAVVDETMQPETVSVWVSDRKGK
jgi:hypothetical protein